VIQLCQKAGAKEVACLSLLPEANWESTGNKQAITEAGGKLVIIDMKDEAKFTAVKIPMGVELKEACNMKEFFNYDIFINMPINKDHANNKFTGTLKNLMGLNSPKNNRLFHKTVN
jgi:uncharacterized protein (DUF362 family)